VGQAADAWDKFRSMMERGEFDEITEVYSPDTLFLEPFNPPHRGNLLTQAYLKDYFSEKANIAVDEAKRIEAADGKTIAIEWALSYDAAGRRWNNLPRATFLEVDEHGQIAVQRDYS
jgi:ketosteroid isomerase-like protein